MTIDKCQIYYKVAAGKHVSFEWCFYLQRNRPTDRCGKENIRTKRDKKWKHLQACVQDRLSIDTREAGTHNRCFLRTATCRGYIEFLSEMENLRTVCYRVNWCCARRWFTTFTPPPPPKENLRIFLQLNSNPSTQSSKVTSQREHRDVNFDRFIRVSFIVNRCFGYICFNIFLGFMLR